MVSVLRVKAYNISAAFYEMLGPRKRQARQHGKGVDKVRSPHAADVNPH